MNRSFEELTDKELEMLQNNTHPGIKECLAKLLHNIEQKILLFRSRRDIEIEKILKEFEAAKEAAISESRVLEQELARSLQKSLLNQLKELEKQEQREKFIISDHSSPSFHQSTIISCTLTPAEINHDLSTMKAKIENNNQQKLVSVSFDGDKLFYSGKTFSIGDNIRIECPPSENLPGNSFDAMINSIQNNNCIIMRNNDLVTIDLYQLETGQYIIKLTGH